ncbi:N-acetylmuramoyl-L-alanine amidase [Thioalkalivibrio sp. ALMg9]|uniref:N-acetylmuramoyl-L-alanine amidase n=1 Tax=Thioalkalivibrio sp. ALMg9 TaxID=1266912 RepID=UPI0003808D81|nr:N-acetylmuramoyl-L-alanine amidase [Thioalkalivibrio sp. ALMg9]
MSRARPIDAIDHLIIHCSASPNGRADTAADIDQWHARNGWRRGAPHGGANDLHHIGYHWVIELDGHVAAGRGLLETGAHAGPAMNGRSVGICLIGTDRFTQAQWDQLACQVRRLRDKLPGEVTIIGHRDVPANKRCPGFDVAGWLERGMEPEPDQILEVAS